MQRLPLVVQLLAAFVAVMVVRAAVAAMLDGLPGGGAAAWGIAVVAAGGLAYWLSRRIGAEIDQAVGDLDRVEQSLESGRRVPVFPVEGGRGPVPELRKQVQSLAESTSKRVTGLLAANRDLEQNKTLFQSILETMVEGVLVLDADGRILYINRAARQLLDLRSRNVEGRLVWEVVRTADLQEAINAVYATGEDFRREFEFQRSRTVVEVTATRLMLAPDPGLVVVLHNVTELRRLEHLRREFVSNVSHELKTPLTSIQAYADTLLEGGLDDPENSRLFVSRIVEQSDRLQMLIQDMLRLARIESQTDAFQLQPVSLPRVLAECIDARGAVAKARGVDLRLDDGESEIDVLADAEGVRTIFDNLVNNALNYTPEGGHVDVRCRVDGEQAVIEVQDDGIGIPAEHQERIFERFYRVDKARSRGMGGTGLGLAIVKHLTNVFNGGIEVESHVGRGSLFRVRLPLASTAVSAAQTSRPEPSTGPGGHN